MRFSLIIPCFNEAENLPLLLERCKDLAEQTATEIIFVNNGSTDNSDIVLKELLPSYPGCRSIHVRHNKGYGFGILAGLDSANGDIVGWTHADMQTDPMDAIEGLQKYKEYGSQLFVKGQRYGRPLGDTLFTVGMSFFETLLLRKPMWDINAQPTMFPRSFYKTWQEPPHDFSLDLFAYYQAKIAKLDVKRFPVLFGERAHGVSHWNVDWAAKRKFIRRTIEFSLQLRRKVMK
jgi:glycosyltransferase involved in cell wall biosynthesis